MQLVYSSRMKNRSASKVLRSIKVTPEVERMADELRGVYTKSSVYELAVRRLYSEKSPAQVQRMLAEGGGAVRGGPGTRPAG